MRHRLITRMALVMGVLFSLGLLADLLNKPANLPHNVDARTESVAATSGR